MSLRVRLVAALATVAILLAVPALYAALRLDALRSLAVELRERHVAATASVSRLSAELGRLNQLLRSHVATGRPAAAAAADSVLAGVRGEMTALRELGYAEESRIAGTLVGDLGWRVTEIERLVAERRMEAATDAFTDLERLVSRTRSALDTVSAAIDRESARAVTRAETLSTTATRNAFLGLLAALLLAGIVGVALTRDVVGPMKRLEQGMADVAEGSFDPPEDLSYERGDEIGELARSFRSMAERLRELRELKAEFVSALTHRLKTPVSVIRGYAGMLADGELGPVNDRQRETLGEVAQQTDDMAERVDHLLQLTRMESGTLSVEPEDVRLEDLLHELREAFEPLARQRRIGFRIDVALDVSPVIRADPDRVRDDVLGNLLTNAFKFTDAGGQVELRAEASDDGVSLVVEDDGRGIPEEDVEHVFDPYFRTEDGRETEGTGLGLSIAREVVELHGGTIRVSSRRGEGARFTVELPAAAPSQPARREPTRARGRT